ncbi:hypothetical protein OG914_06835 [Streptomyces sp. NBC_00291]|uniref:hypothetical protein n=1 Tax=Streptomyces sp. NBC_00291 TaxID=2975704 RepID=UPI00224E094A|nr:hypothetical protein [Streptomyces sp. NBC_00291]MCX5153725.1 hypothetical protein [Streptomyces sp. NBC_00291]
MSNATPNLPAVEDVAARARQIMSAIEADPEFDAFTAAALKYDDAWTCFTGFPVIEKWNLDDDKRPLLKEGLRALALKAAVYELGGQDEDMTEIPVSVPVDEMMHAMIAQPQLLARIAERVGISVIHQTDKEHHEYVTGDYTHGAYVAAWGEPNTRYWLDHEEVNRRLVILEAKYEEAGFRRSGKEHTFDFAAA